MNLNLILKKSFNFQLCLVGLVLDFAEKFFLSTLHFVVVVNIAVLTFAFCVGKSLTGMLAISRVIVPSILVIAVIAHPHRIDRKVGMLAAGNLALLPTSFASFYTAWFWTVFWFRAHFHVY